jgi:nucleoside-diphosphate-sugar epimerase
MGPELVVVTGAGGFIGGHLTRHLAEQGARIRAVDVKPLDRWHQVVVGAENLQLDLRGADACDRALEEAAVVYNLAADMGGMGFIEANKARCMLSVLINTHLLQSAIRSGVKRYFFASSACVYAREKQLTPDIPALKESDAYPAEPEDGYGWEKLFSERMCRHFSEDFGLTTRVARYHNVYGPNGTWEGGREKAPAAICRKVAEAQLSGRHEIEIWGDGEQTRSFMYIDDCIEGTRRIMESDIAEPINLGSSEMVTINQLVDLVEDIAGLKLNRHYILDAPKGVRGRNSDNTMIRERLAWEPSTLLRTGLSETYRWIFDQVLAQALVTARGSQPRQPAIAVPRLDPPVHTAGDQVAA